jgi:polyphosphate kinase
MLDAPHVDLEDPSLYFSQETSWLKFNERVLDEAADTRHPLLERLKFLAIFSNNLDEYFMVRVAALMQQLEAEVTRRSVDGRLPAEQLVALAQSLRPMLDRHLTILRHDIMPALEKHDVRVIPYKKLPGMTQARLRELFIENVFPVLTPLAVDHTHPFPYISNLSLSLAVEIEDQSDATAHSFARVKVPNSLPRFVPLGEGHPHHYVLFEELIAGNLDLLFPGMTVIAAWPFRATRDADLDLQEDEAHDLLSVAVMANQCGLKSMPVCRIMCGRNSWLRWI